MREFILWALVTLLVCTAASGVSGSCFGCFKAKTTSKPTLAVDFDGLGEYLTGKVSNGDSEANLEVVRADVFRLSGGVARAADILLALEKADQCDDELISLLNEAHTHDLRLNSRKRVPVVIRAHLMRVLDLCTSYVERNVEGQFNRLIGNNANLGQFARFFNADNVPWPVSAFKKSGDVPIEGYSFLVSGTARVVDPVYVAQMLREMLYADPAYRYKGPAGLGQPLEKLSQRRFDEAYERHLEEPCRQLRASVGKHLQQAEILMDILDDTYSFLGKRSPNYRSIAWRNGACRHLLSFTREQKTSISRDFL